jgi:hypothetical protein
VDNWAAQVAVQFFFCGWGSSVIVNYRRWVAKGPSGRGQGIAGERTGYLRAPKPHHKAPASYPALCLAMVLAGL